MKTISTLPSQQARQGFTLIELLIVIAIIATLAGISAPMILTKLDDAKKIKGEAIAQQLEIAIDNFHNDYFKLPSPEIDYPLEDNTQFPYVAEITDQFGPSMLRILANQETEEPKVNHKGVEYFVPTEGKIGAKGAIGGASLDDAGRITGLYDQFGQPFHIILNFDHDSGTDVPAINPSNGSKAANLKIKKLPGRDSAVFSAGKDGKVLTRDDSKTWQ